MAGVEKDARHVLLPPQVRLLAVVHGASPKLAAITDLKVEYHPDPSLGRAVSESMADNSSGRGDD